MLFIIPFEGLNDDTCKLLTKNMTTNSTVSSSMPNSGTSVETNIHLNIINYLPLWFLRQRSVLVALSVFGEGRWNLEYSSIVSAKCNNESLHRVSTSIHYESDWRLDMFIMPCRSFGNATIPTRRYL